MLVYCVCRYQDGCVLQILHVMWQSLESILYVNMLFVSGMDVLLVLAGGCIIVFIVFFCCIGCSASVFVLGFAGDQFCSTEERICLLSRPQVGHGVANSAFITDNWDLHMGRVYKIFVFIQSAEEDYMKTPSVMVIKHEIWYNSAVVEMKTYLVHFFL